MRQIGSLPAGVRAQARRQGRRDRELPGKRAPAPCARRSASAAAPRSVRHSMAAADRGPRCQGEEGGGGELLRLCSFFFSVLPSSRRACCGGHVGTAQHSR